ncbi:MAG: EamA family transporter [Chthoniobacteraceae bacterium]
MFSLWVWAGIVAGLISMVGWLAALRRMPLSIAFIHSNVVHITVPICCWVFLGEEINLQRWLGIAFVLAGITCIAKPLAHIEEAH